MKYAIISDVHGNLPALNAVLRDAEKKNVEGYIFVGDYCLSNPYPNECITRIRKLKNTYVIRGNEERYLENLVGKDQSTWTDGQMQISYFCYREVSEENLNYLLSLPACLNIALDEVPIHIAHSSENFIGKCEHEEWGPAKVAVRYGEENVTSERFRGDMRGHFESDETFQKVAADLQAGVYIFGHSHIQWSYKSKDGKKVFINPGSCGLPLDCIREGVPYTILDLSDNENWQVEEVRVPFDMESHIEELRASKQFTEARVWSNVIIKELRTCREHLTFFLSFAEEYATKIGDSRRPFSVETWERAYEVWEKERNKM